MLRPKTALAVLVLAPVLAIGSVAPSLAATPITVVAGSLDTADTTVDGTCDAPCSLRGAIQTVDRGIDDQFTVVVPAGTFALAIAAVLPDPSSAANGDLDITRNTTISGAGQAATTIDGGGVDRVFDVAAGVTTTIRDMTITGGLARDGFASTAGGAIRDWGALTLADATLTGNVAQDGAGLATDAASYPPPTIPTATLNRVTVLDNHAAPGSEGGGLNERVGGTLTVNASLIKGNTADSGGGIVDDGGGAIVINDSTITENHATAPGSEAGGVYETGGGTVTITRSTVSRNTSGEGGGVAEDGGGRVTIVDSTISDNVVSGGSFPDAGGILRDANGMVVIRGSTISGNSATRSGGGLQDIGGGALGFDIANSTISNNHAGLRGGAIQEGAGAVKLVNSTLSGNTADGGAAQIDVCLPIDAQCGGNVTRSVTAQNTIVAGGAGSCLGAVTSAGHNIDAGDSCGFSASGDLVNTDPLLDPLAANGGPTLTHAERSGSPAIDRGDPAACPVTDQRGIARPAGPACDIGAFETSVLAVLPPVPRPAPTPTPAAPKVAPKVTITDVVSLPSTRRCVSRRRFTIRIRALKGVKVVSATVTVSGKPAVVFRGKRLTSTINLRGLPRGRFTVTIRVRTTAGGSLTGTRRYRTCVPKRLKAKKHRL